MTHVSRSEGEACTVSTSFAEQCPQQKKWLPFVFALKSLLPVLLLTHILSVCRLCLAAFNYIITHWFCMTKSDGAGAVKNGPLKKRKNQSKSMMASQRKSFPESNSKTKRQKNSGHG